MKYSLYTMLLVLFIVGTGVVPAATLQHRYDFFNDVSDVAGSADGSLVSGALISGGAVHLNGSGAYVELPAGIVSGNTDITIEAWVTDNGSGNWARIFDFGSGTGTYMFLSPRSGAGTLRAAITIESGEQLLEWPGTRLPVGSAKHVVWTYDSASNTGQLYVDGTLVDENTGMSLSPADMGYTTQNWLGRSQWAADSYFYGSIDEFRIYDGALTGAEVLYNYAAGPDGPPSGAVEIYDNPVSQTVEEARPVTFGIAYVGSAPVAVQWYRDSLPISGATNDTYTIEAVSLGDSGASFHAAAANLYEGTPYTDISASATLTVTADTTAPTLDKSSSLYPAGVRVEFSEGISDATALNAGNYSITHDGGSLAITGAAFGEDKSVVILTTGMQVLETGYTLHVSNVQDRSSAANTIAADSQSSFIATSYLTEDIGSPVIESSVTWLADGVDITAGGAGMGGTSDQFSLSHKSYSGNFDVQVRIAGMDHSNVWARAGLMARDGLDADALFAAAFATPGSAGCQFMARSSVGGGVATEGSFPARFPGTWLRLRRTGNLFEGFAGIDGSTWQPLGSAIIFMSTTVEVGFALTSSDSASVVTAGFREESTGGGTIVSSIPLPFEPLGPSSRRGAIVISEIMVDAPSEWGGTNSLEFVEIYNAALITEDLSGHRLSGEIDYTFPDGTMLAPGGFIVVAKDPTAAQSFYGVPCLGPYDGKLDNKGGTLRFRNELNGILLEVEYDNRAPWPVAAFGSGHSLVLSHPSYGENDARAWSASDLIGGSPGATDGYGADSARGVVINEYLAHTDLPQVDYIELFNTGTSPVDLSGAWLSDEAGTNKYRITGPATIPARGFLSFDQNELGFALSADGEEIYLVNSNQTRVIDAVSFRGQANGVTEGRYPDGAPNFQELGSVTEGHANTAPLLRSVVINEIMYHPISESSNDEFIELYNRTGSPVDISNWRLQGGISYQFPAGTQIPANGYVVVAENVTNLTARYTQLNASNTYGNYGGTLGNGGDTVRLSVPEDLISTNVNDLVVTNIFYIPIDEVTYRDGGRWGEWSDGGGSSLELIDPDADNRQPANWADSDESAKAPWTTIDVTEILENGQAYVDEGSAVGEAADCNRLELYMQGAGEVLIDDVEFLNNGGSSLCLNGNFSSGSLNWSFGGIARNSYVESDAGPDGSDALHLVCAARGDAGANKVFNSFSSVPSITGTDTGTLRAKVRWLKGAEQIYLRLRGNWMEVCRNINVPTDCGTPGLANSQRISNAGPAIYDVVHGPILPEAGEAVRVTARAVDPDGISSLILNYRIDPAASYSTAAMVDNGSGGDAVAGDGLYSAIIPGEPGGALAAFYISAADGSALSRFPADAPERECLLRWGESDFSGGLGTYRLWLTQANVSFWNSREVSANDNIDATFVYGNHRVVYNVGTMYSGSPFHSAAYNGVTGSVPCDYEINFPTGDHFLGSRPFVLSGEDVAGGFWYDTSTQVDLTGTWIGRKLGQQYNYRRHVHMVVNGLERGDIYLDGQQPNGEMLDEYFPNDSKSELRKIEDWFEYSDDLKGRGNIYGRIGRVEKSTGEIDAKWYRWNWRPRATDDHANWLNFTNLVDVVNDSGAADWESRVRTWMDVRNFLRPIAVYHICGCWDTYAYDRGKNAYAFKPDDEGWRLLLWDIEIALGNGSNGSSDSIYRTVDSALFNMITSIPSIHREYLMAFQEAVDGPLAEGVAASIVNERYANLAASGVTVGSPQFIIDYINARRSYLQGILPAAGFGVDGSGTFSVSSNSAVLTGTAPLRVADIRVNGIPYPVEWTSTTAWSLTVPLTAGLNNLSVTGVDRFGNLVSGASEELSITWTGSDLDPEDVVLISEIHPSPEDRTLQFLEIRNTSATDIFDLSGWRINGIGYTFPAGSIIGVGEYIVLVADVYRFADQHRAVPVFDVYDGSLDPQGETLTLFRPGTVPGEEIVVDRIRYESAAPWASSAGVHSLQLVDAAQDNARVANWSSTVESALSAPVSMVGFDHNWKYYQSGDPGSGWEEAGFNDNPWPSGDALLYVENSNLPVAKNTALSIGETAYYFRATFDYSGSTAGVALNLSTVVDDGMILYLNGTEIHRLGINEGRTIVHSSLADREIGNAQVEGPFILPASALISGENVLAAEVHQRTTGSSDIVFGITLDVVDSDAEPSTPGAANSVAETRPVIPDVWLNELQADNSAGLQDNFGDSDPWVELYNAGTSAFSLDGFYLTDDYGIPTKWAFPSSATIPAGGFLVVWCDGEPGETIAGVPHTDFVLPSPAGQIGLVRLVNSAPQVVDYLNYTNLPSNYSYGDVPDGQPFYRFDLFYPTPGATNSGAAAPITVSINEWMADNDGTLSDPADGNYEDWFELYNPGTNMVDLGGYFLTDDLADPYRYEVPDTGHYTIEPGGYLLVWADGEPGQNSTNRLDLHAGFSLSKSGESIGVFAFDGTVIDAVTFTAQVSDVSEGRIPDGSAVIMTMDTPTPRAANSLENTAPVLDAIADITMTLGQVLDFFAGATDYDTPAQTFAFSLSGAPPGATIHPTTGAFSWTPGIAPSTNTMAVVVVDNGMPALSDTEWFTVTVVQPPVVADLAVSEGDISFNWPSVPGQPYQVYYKDELVEFYWNPLGDIMIGTGGMLNFTNSISESPRRFYRIGVE